MKWIEPFVQPKLSNNVAAQVLHVQQVWDAHGLDGDGQVVAVADTGLDTGLNDGSMHDDFEGRIATIHSWPIPTGLHLYLDNTSWDDGAADMESGHGTHVAGSVLGNGTRSGGTIRGMAPRARLAFHAVEQYLNVKPAYQGQLPDGYYLVGIPGDLNTLFQQAYDEGRASSQTVGVPPRTTPATRFMASTPQNPRRSTSSSGTTKMQLSCSRLPTTAMTATLMA